MIDQKFQCSIFYGNFDQNSKYTLVYLVTISQAPVLSKLNMHKNINYDFSLIHLHSGLADN